jgi:hypothetical protein
VTEPEQVDPVASLAQRHPAAHRISRRDGTEARSFLQILPHDADGARDRGAFPRRRRRAVDPQPHRQQPLEPLGSRRRSLHLGFAVVCPERREIGRGVLLHYEADRGEAVLVDLVAGDVIVMPVGVDHVAHRFAGELPDGRDGLQCRRAGELRVDHHYIGVANDDQRVRVDREAQRVLSDRGKHGLSQLHHLQLGRAGNYSARLRAGT